MVARRWTCGSIRRPFRGSKPPGGAEPSRRAVVSVLQLNFHSVCREVEAQSLRGPEQLDDDTLLVPQVVGLPSAGDCQSRRPGDVISIEVLRL